MDASRRGSRSRARQWSRAAWVAAALFASLPIASRIFLGSWEFDDAAEIACVFLVLGVYFHIRGRQTFRSVPDSATILDEAFQLAASGRTDAAIARLTDAIRLEPRLWQAFQYRGELYLRQQRADAALRDFADAISLAPHEPHLNALRDQAESLAGENRS